MIPLNLIVCATKSNGIGQAGRLPWRLKEDMKFFKHVTSLSPLNQKNVVIMGRKTWESLPLKFRPLSNRINIVISRQSKNESSLGINSKQDCYLVNSIDSACELIESLKKPEPMEDRNESSNDINRTNNSDNNNNNNNRSKINKVFIIGGSELYKTILKPKQIDLNSNNQLLFKPINILMTRILSDHKFIESSIDTYFPEFRFNNNQNQNWIKSNDLKIQNDFLILGNNNNNNQLENQSDHDIHKFKFDQLIIEDSFLYKFELWTNINS